jgi:hypothetical protein
MACQIVTRKAYIILAFDKETIANFASSGVDITTKPRRRDALSTVARITQCDTVPYRENISVNSVLESPGCNSMVMLSDITYFVRANGKPRT